MRFRSVAGVVVGVPAAVVLISVSAHHVPAGPVVRPAPVVHVAPAGQSGPASSGKSHTVVKSLATRAVYHVVPHPRLPYLFRPRVFRWSRLFRRY